MPEVTDKIPVWPRFPLPPFWKSLKPPHKSMTVLILLPLQLTVEAVEMIIRSCHTCPYPVLIGGPKALFYRLHKILMNVSTHKVTPANFRDPPKKCFIKYFVAKPRV